MSVSQLVLDQYQFGKIESIAAVTDGLIHATYKITSTKGVFILQKLHSLLCDDGVGEDFLEVTHHLDGEGIQTPVGILNIDGKVLTKDGEEVWRVQSFIEGKVFDRMDSPERAKEAGKMLAKFHLGLSDLDYTFQSSLILHQTRKIADEFKEVVKKFAQDDLMSDAKEQVAFLIAELPKYFLPEDLPIRVTHGDPKLTNILFNDDGSAASMIDLDTCNRGTVLVDLGDAFRSWCGGVEDDESVVFNKEIFQAGLEGYKEFAEGEITDKEIELIPQATAMIILELATRFLKDYFEDSYFGWDKEKYPTRRAHNLARAKGQIALFKSFSTLYPTPNEGEGP
jgi:Ser/Thr protein kinase RdoA (MazF antagonist)